MRAPLARLKEQKVPTGSAGRQSILVPSETLHEIRMQLASEGLPQGGGIGFEVFDNTKLGLSEFAQNVNYQRALQGELARTISRIAEVESCRVHLVMPEKTLFVSNEQPASASVAVKLKSGRQLSRNRSRASCTWCPPAFRGLFRIRSRWWTTAASSWPAARASPPSEPSASNNSNTRPTSKRI
jgi:hypothetical protein